MHNKVSDLYVLPLRCVRKPSLFEFRDTLSNREPRAALCGLITDVNW